MTKSGNVIRRGYVINRKEIELRVGANPIDGSSATVLLLRVCVRVSESVTKRSAAGWERCVPTTDYETRAGRLKCLGGVSRERVTRPLK